MPLLLFAAAIISLQVSLSCSTNLTEGWTEIHFPPYSGHSNATSSTPCTLFTDSLTQKIKNKTKVTLMGCQNKQRFDLTSQLQISMVDNLHISGGETGSTVHCKGDNNTGLTFTKISNLRLENLHILECGSPHENAEITVGSVSITDCINVTITNVTIAKSRGVGLALINTGGQVTVINSTVSDSVNGGGMVIDIDSSRAPASYTLQNCKFFNNGIRLNEEEILWQFMNNSSQSENDFHMRGGGLQLLAKGNLSNSSFTINFCNFSSNRAPSGGGMFVVVQDGASNNSVIVSQTDFTSNECEDGGGALQIGYIQDSSVINNRIVVNDSKFKNNAAEYGGGTAIFSTLGSHLESNNTLHFINCVWIKNHAKLGLAVDIALAPWETFLMNRNLPSPVFTNCTFAENKDKTVNKTRTTFVTTGFRVEFRKNTIFQSNLGSAIEATSSILDFQANSTVKFVSNQGMDGGALNMRALTVMYVRDNSSFYFEQNIARRSGGAIYFQSYDKHVLVSSTECFLQYKGNKKEQRNVSFVFRENYAGYSIVDNKPQEISKRQKGDSLYATSLFPCLKMCMKSFRAVPMTVKELLQCTGNFSFDQSNKTRRQLSTTPDHFAHTDTECGEDTMCPLCLSIANGSIWNNTIYRRGKVHPINRTLYFIPGKNSSMPLKLVDEFCGEVSFHVSIEVKTKCSIFIQSAHSTITDNYITLYGKPHDSGVIQLFTLGARYLSIGINVTMDSCPPGYVYDESESRCRCSSNINGSRHIGIDSCDEKEFRAYIRHGYWAGYLNSSNDPQDLATAVCPKGFCTTKHSREHLLPSNCKQDLSMYVCNENKTGRVCSKCKENYSAYYHSNSYSCKTNDLCDLGPLFYILSELVPVTLLFLFVIFFNISFTSGPLNGVIFFMQVVDMLKLNAENFIHFDETVLYFVRIHKFIYRMFSLNFFSLEKLSFCLWRGASALDLMAFKYVTIVYSLILVIATVLMLRICNFQICGCTKNKNLNLKRSIIHGLSAFLVMSYSECTRVSFMIITRGVLHYIGPKNHISYVAFYNGDYPYMGAEHLKYAIPAIFFIMSMVAIPPLLLFGYPLCYKLFALLRIEESRCVEITCKLFPLEKIKPMFDSIQCAFKDQYRFFAGLYFLYRLSALLTFTFSNGLTTHYTVIGIQLVCMLTMHAICRPYKQAWHNILDAAFLSTLVVVNAMTLYNYQLVSGSVGREREIEIMTGIQSVLILWPLVYLVIYTLYCIVVRLRAACVHKADAQETSADNSDDTMLDVLDNRALDDYSDNYMLLEEPSKSTGDS